MSKKMSKEIKLIVESTNKMLLTKEMQENKEDRDTITSFLSYLLLQRNMYHGFNYYIEKDGNLRLAGKETNLVQFYIV